LQGRCQEVRSRTSTSLGGALVSAGDLERHFGCGCCAPPIGGAELTDDGSRCGEAAYRRRAARQGGAVFGGLPLESESCCARSGTLHSTHFWIRIPSWSGASWRDGSKSPRPPSPGRPGAWSMRPSLRASASSGRFPSGGWLTGSWSQTGCRWSRPAG
jgi:hypothetical protein